MLNGYVKCKESSGPYFKKGQVVKTYNGSIQRIDGSVGTSIYKDLDDLNDRNCGLYAFEPYVWEPAKKLLESGMKLILENDEIRFVLLETGGLYEDNGVKMSNLDVYDDDLTRIEKGPHHSMYTVKEIYKGDVLIAKRNVKETESLKEQALDLVEKLHEVVKKIQDKASL